MDITESKVLAKVASPTGKIKRSVYIPRYKHDAIYLNNLDEELFDRDNKSLERDMNYNNEIYKTDIIKSKLCSYYHKFTITKNKEQVWNLWLIIHGVNIEIGGSTVFGSFNMLYNLMFASLLNKNIIYEDNKIFVPIVVLDLICPKKLPLYLLEYYEFNITINFNKTKIDNLLELKYDWYRFKDQTLLNKGVQFNIVQIDVNLNKKPLDKKMILHINHPSQLLLFEIFNDNEYSESLLQEIRLYLDECSPIVFSSNKGEIIKFNILGKEVYVISLCSKFMYKEDIKKLFFRNNDEIIEGIDFSRITNTCVELDFDIPITGKISVSNVCSNQLNISAGMAKVTYCS